MRKQKRRVLPALLAALMLFLAALPASAATSATAATMQLSRYTGTVSVTNSSGRALSMRNNMLLYSGYRVQTGAKSYAWINLDNTKLTKLDASSKVEIRRSGQKLELLLSSGHVYFNVTSPLTSGETLNIRTSTMVTGIRGTCGWINVVDRWTTEIYVLEGAVQCNVTDPVTGQIKTTTVESGEKAVATAYPQDQKGNKCEFTQEKIEVEDINGFVLEELAQDPELREEILKKSGLDVSDAAENAQERLERDEREMQAALDRVEAEVAAQDKIVSGGIAWTPAGSGSEPGTSGGSTSGGTGSGGGNTGGSTGGGDSGNTGGGTGGDSGNTGGGTTPEVPDNEDDGGGDDPNPIPPETPDEPDDNDTISVQITNDLTIEEIEGYWNDGYGTVILEANTDDTSENTLTVDDVMTIPVGKTLTLSGEISVNIADDGILNVNGTMTGVSSSITVNAGGALDVSGTLTVNGIGNAGVLMNESSGTITASITTAGEEGTRDTGLFSSAGAINGTVTVNGGDAEITKGTVNGAVTLTGGTFTMSGGKIDGGTHTAVNITGGTFAINGGEVTSEVAPSSLVDLTPDSVTESLATIHFTSWDNLELNSGTITNSYYLDNEDSFDDNDGGYVLYITGSTTEQDIISNLGSIINNSSTIIRARGLSTLLIYLDSSALTGTGSLGSYGLTDRDKEGYWCLGNLPQ